LIYLDNNATTRPSDAAAQAAHVALSSLWANPSSVHRAGQEVRHAIELARKELAALLAVPPKELILTSSGTESVDLAIRGVIDARATRDHPDHPARPPTGPAATRPLNLVTTPIEHAAVRELARHLEAAGRVELRPLPLDSRGMADPEALPGLLDDRTALVSVQWANNETGVIQPIERIAEACRKAGVPLHCDAVQWVGKMPVLRDEETKRRRDGVAQGVEAGERTSSLRLSVSPSLPCDLLTLSAHKFHGPKGVGALWARRGFGLVPQTLGTQELDRRGGTENVAGIIGAGVAAREAVAWLADPAARARLAALRDRFEQSILRRVPGAAVNGHDCPRLWNTSNIAFPALEAEALLMLLSERGLAASAGAACSSGSLDPSPVLLAMGIPEKLAHGSLRFSLSRETTPQEIDEAIEIVVGAATQLHRSSSSSL
jgi:cysteine desulfurase